SKPLRLLYLSSSSHIPSRMASPTTSKAPCCWACTPSSPSPFTPLPVVHWIRLRRCWL
ncbi:hypothetical protein E4U33_003957, partial [Claviceps sp. LM78 group G4]